jgi:hypothetical protein
MRTLTEICDHEGKTYSKDYYRFSPNVKSVAEMELKMGLLSPSIHKFDNEFIHSGLSAALGHETCRRAHVESLGPNGVSNFDVISNQNTLLYLRIEALRQERNHPGKDSPRKRQPVTIHGRIGGLEGYSDSSSPKGAVATPTTPFPSLTAPLVAIFVVL